MESDEYDNSPKGDTRQPLLAPDNTDDESDWNEPYRNLAAFWIFGMCNNFGYVVMLSAAFDILKVQEHNSNTTTHVHTNVPHNSTGFHCNPISTGLVLLADILPCFALKLTAPFYMQKISYHIRIAFSIVFLALSLSILALSSTILVSLLAVILASVSSGLGEITFLSLSSHFKKSTIPCWASGTGMSGVLGSVAYAGLLQIGLTRQNAVLSLLIVPFVFTISVWGLLDFPDHLKYTFSSKGEKELTLVTRKDVVVRDKTKDMSLISKLSIMLTLKQYMLPLFIVYLAEYTINQGLYELLYYNVSWLTQAQQYRWFQVDYQIAVFISRSSVYIFHIKKVFYLSLGQCLIFCLLLLEVIFTFIPNIFITLFIIFVEGLFGGAVYGNTFYNMSEEVDEGIREFSLGAASVSDSCGISLSSLISIPLHNVLCKLKEH